MRRERNAKIVATLGPASSSPGRIEALHAAGADAFRLNFSHGTRDEQRQRIEAIRAVEARVGRPIAVLADLQGPKLRVGELATPAVELEPGAALRLDQDPAPGDARRVPLPHPELYEVLRPGMELLIDDGRLRLRVEAIDGERIETRVEVGGALRPHKGVNVPDVVLPLSPLTGRDREDLACALEWGVDWVAASFVQRPADLDELRALIGGRAALMAKIERPSAVDHLDGILERADGLMVARGDLGVELPPERVPGIQKGIVRACLEAGKPVVVATQMLESMITSPVPTRAEASDVASAVYEGADAVMLSGETAAGSYPVEAVRMMDRIVVAAERDAHYRAGIDAHLPEPQATVADAICDALHRIAHTLPVAAVVAYTSSGFSALRAARERPEAPIIGLTPQRTTARRLALVWGVHAIESADVTSVQEMVERAIAAAVGDGFARPGDCLVIMAGMPFGVPGTTNLLRIARVEGSG